MAYLRSTPAVLATADDLNGTSDNTQAFDVTGCFKAFIFQINNGTAGTAGIDVIEVSHDGGATWASDDTVMAVAQNDATGDILASGALNAAGVEPPNGALFTAGPWEGPTAIRCTRNASVNASSVAWSTGAPTVQLIAIGGKHSGGALTALA